MNNETKKIAFYTLGCKLNFSETSTLARKFLENGFERVNPSQPADMYVINTCSVTEQADKKCRQAIRRFIKQSPVAFIVVTGCYAQLKPEEIAKIDGVDLVLGADAKGNLLEYVNNIREKGEVRIFSCEINQVDSFFPAFSSGDRTRSFLKVQDGCDYKCSYCTIPMARGRSRNIPIANIVKEAGIIAQSRTKEIILTGVNIGDFGRTTSESFFGLIKELEKVNGIERYRISSIEPNLLTGEIIEVTANSSKFLPHFHIPLQSGNNKILRLMRRRYRRELFAKKIESIRKFAPHAFIGIDVIVGFPGETEEDFMDTYTFLEGLQPAYIHIFPYSERANTATVTMPGKVRDNEITMRTKRLAELCRKLHHDFYLANIGKTSSVLFESAHKAGKMHGFTENYIKVELDYNKKFVGQVKNVRLIGLLSNETMSCELL
ncbi:MAG: tRNA (N(6)-L-threonylcarbamoyladenosine(37)-C(2))-methylthiotransferase MtaB [Prevotellaceae bacterium]|jgi:threonylcarbamoyladenosine tRNA methylthiotransferase MtaB|nr:tRNA (N(6)-L-threonylcarbamoyladenosine(37)-C(2))-methylthiotransferase MtaB [Prevotellaceae bacterium]